MSRGYSVRYTMILDHTRMTFQVFRDDYHGRCAVYDGPCDPQYSKENSWIFPHFRYIWHCHLLFSSMHQICRTFCPKHFPDIFHKPFQPLVAPSKGFRNLCALMFPSPCIETIRLSSASLSRSFSIRTFIRLNTFYPINYRRLYSFMSTTLSSSI